MNTLKLEIREVKTFRELLAELGPDEQGSGSLEGTVIFQGKELMVRKHWSYEGGYPAMVVENGKIVDEIELVSDGNWWDWKVDGVQQYDHNVEKEGWELLDSNLIIKK
jgi:hypothetical protein